MPGRIAEVVCDNDACLAKFELTDGVSASYKKIKKPGRKPETKAEFHGFEQKVCLHCKSVQSLFDGATKCKTCKAETVEWQGMMDHEIAMGPCPKCDGELEQTVELGVWD